MKQSNRKTVQKVSQRRANRLKATSIPEDDELLHPLFEDDGDAVYHFLGVYESFPENRFFN